MDGDRLVEFVERFCPMTRGPHAGQPTRLRDWQQDILYALAAPGVRRALVGLPRKNGKSSLMAGLALYSLAAAEEPRPEVYGAAGTRQQARLVFDEAASMVRSGPLAQSLTVHRHEILNPANGGVYRVLAAESYSAEGLDPLTAIVDELHVIGEGGSSRGLWDVLTLGSGARTAPLTVGITTAGWDRQSLCYQLYELGRAGGDPAFAFRWWEAPAGCDTADEGAWASANPALGDWLSVDDMRTAQRQSEESAFRRYRLNQWVGSRAAWLPPGLWASATGPGLEAPPDAGADVVLAFDGSFSGDSTALVGATAGGRPHLWVEHLQEAGPLAPPGWRVDVAAAEDAIREACRRWRVLAVACDPYRWQRTMQALESEGLPIIEWPTTSVPRMVQACSAIVDALHVGGVTHTGDARLARHVDACAVKEDRQGVRVVKEHRDSGRHIDLAVCAIVAHSVARQAEPTGWEPHIWW